MLMDVSKDIIKSCDTFKELIEPELAKILGGQIICIEGVSDPMYKQMDLLAGLDALHISDEGIRGIASRIQYGAKDWSTFTIRMSRENGTATEFDKRQWSIDNDYIYPYYTVQAYVHGNKLISLAIARTADIIKMVNDGYGVERTVKEDGYDATFRAVKWIDVDAQGHTIVIVR